jgi:hypothetical protein
VSCNEVETRAEGEAGAKADAEAVKRAIVAKLNFMVVGYLVVLCRFKVTLR